MSDTGPAALRHQFEVAMMVRNSPDVPPEIRTAVLSDALESDDLRRFVARQAALTSVVVNTAADLVAALLSDRQILARALVRAAAGQPLTPADIGLDADQILRLVGLTISQDGPV